MTSQLVSGQDFALTLTNTPGPVVVGSNLVYSLSVSNARSFDLLPGLITSVFPNGAQFVSATNSHGGITNSIGMVTFSVDEFTNGAVIDIGLVLQPTEPGLLTNQFTVTAPKSIPAETNAVTQIIAGFADLGVTIQAPPSGVFLGDTFTYRLIASNAGPDSAPDVVVSNPFPSEVILIGLSPSTLVRLTNGAVLFSPATGQSEAAVTVRADSTNRIDLWANITAPDIIDDNPTNNTFSTNVSVIEPVLGQIVVTNVSSQEFNQQTGWMEQRVVLENVSTAKVDSVRLLVDGLTNRLVNMAGTNGTSPFVSHGAALLPDERVEMVLEYFNPTRMPGGDPTLTAYGTPALLLTPEEGVEIWLTNTNIVYIQHTNAPNLNNGRILLEWPVSNEGVYQVIYDDQVDFSSAKGSLPLVTAPPSANRIQWLDYGPPRTLTPPTNATVRFYKVVELP